MRDGGKRWITVSWVLALSLPGVAAAAGDVDRGRLLYENHCTGCHTSVAHLRAGRKAHSVDEIRKQVLRWSGHLELQWRASEVTDVVDYLNRIYYDFDAP